MAMTKHASIAGAADPAGRRFLPGMGRDWLLPLYDPFTRLIGVESAHRKLAEQAELATADRVLEIGCGTGNLALLVKRMRSHVEVVGLDPDPKAAPGPVVRRDAPDSRSTSIAALPTTSRTRTGVSTACSHR